MDDEEEKGKQPGFERVRFTGKAKEGFLNKLRGLAPVSPSNGQAKMGGGLLPATFLGIGSYRRDT